jgi:hypothetical protein
MFRKCQCSKRHANYQCYYNSFENLSVGPQSSAAPANPNSNIVEGKLGYFSAHTSQIKQVVIK